MNSAAEALGPTETETAGLEGFALGSEAQGGPHPSDRTRVR